MLRRLGVRGKILATLAVPVIVLIVAAALIVGQNIVLAITAAQTRSIASSTEAHQRVLDSIQAEYASTLSVANGVGGAATSMAYTRGETDKASAAYLAKTASINMSRYSKNVQDAWFAARTELREIETTRATISAALDRADVISPIPAIDMAYNGLIRGQWSIYSVLGDNLTDRTVAQNVSLYADAMILRTAFNEEVRRGLPVVDQRITINPFTAEVTGLAELTRATDAAIESVARHIRSHGISDITVPNPSADLAYVRDSFRDAAPATISDSKAEAWAKDAPVFAYELSRFQNQVRDRLEGSATDAADAGWFQAWLTIGIAVFFVLLSVLIALLIARRIVNPLRRLTAAASDVREKLPTLVEQVSIPGQGPELDFEPIPVESRDEIGQLAETFNDVNATTIEVAREQAALRGSIAEMFVNVARRDHALLNRQLAFLDDLERSEEDPNVLSNLFRLDHLATRMRRNSESLLVLAGIDSGRRLRDAMPLSDVVRTASSEIEAYDRISLTLLDDPSMLGHNALNASHLIAELLENATTFSDPSQPVEVTTSADETYISVSVRDYGLGMSVEETAEANQKVASKSASDIVGANRLGLYVVGRIADRLGAQVEFSAGPGGGTLVVVSFPRALFVQDSTPDSLASRGVADIVAVGDTSFQAPQASEVDLAALTDGSTDAGIPRRKARAAGVADVAPSVGLGEVPDEDRIVLPALNTSDVTDIDAGADPSGWQPLQQLETPVLGDQLPARNGGLPSRAAVAPVIHVEEEITPVATEKRSAIFSSFRTRETLSDFGLTEGLQSDGLAEQPQAAAPEPEMIVPGLVPDLGEEWQAPSENFDPPIQFGEVQGAPAAYEPTPAAYEPPIGTVEGIAGVETAIPPLTLPRHASPDDIDRLTREHDEAVANGILAVTAVEGLPLTGQQPIVPAGAGAAEMVVPHISLADDDLAAPPLTPVFVDEQPSFEPVPVEVEPAQFEASPFELSPFSRLDDAEHASDVLEVPAVETPVPSAEWAFPPATVDVAVPPAFDDVISDVPANAPATPEVAKKAGLFSRMFSRKAKKSEDPATSESAPLRTEPLAAPVNSVAPTFEPDGTQVRNDSAPIEITPVASDPVAEQAEFVEYGAPDYAPVESVTLSDSNPAADLSEEYSAPYAPQMEFPVVDGAPEPTVESTDPGYDSWTPPTALNSVALDALTVGQEATFTPQPVESFEPLGGLAPRDTTPPSAQQTTSWAPSAPEPSGWSPEGNSDGGARSMSPELAAMLASRADIQEQAFSELSQLSSYRPTAVQEPESGSLVKRQRAEVAAPADDPTSTKISRDASVLRSRLSAFQTGINRGRQNQTDDSAETNTP